MIKPTLTEIARIKLISRISDMLLEFSEINKDDTTTSDLQGMAMTKAMNIIKMVKEVK